MGRQFLLYLACIFLVIPSIAQTSSENAAVKLSASIQADPPSITINWVSHPGTSSIAIYRKVKGVTTWGSAIATLSSSATQYQDNTVSTGINYEYRVVRNGSANGYISTGIQVGAPDYRGKILLLVDNSIAPQIDEELQELTLDLRADGWAVVRNDISPTQSASSVRNVVIGRYNESPNDLKAVYIIGHVPVPYSGNAAPDGHSEHVGAWPCDGYYGELTGTWTDNSVNNNGAQRSANRNIPGDGKFDQSNFPSDLELQVGRVDLYDMPAFPQGEVQLLKNYLDRARSYKRKEWSPQVRGLIFDNLQWVSNPLAASAWRNITPLVGPANITVANPYGTAFHSLVNGQSYLWTYSSGGGSQEWINGEPTFNGANNVGTSYDYANGNTGGVFNMSLGSYFGDWDNKNNFLRAPIAKGSALTSCWAGMPAWYFHHMAMGDNIGYSTMITMNNSGLYVPMNDGWQGSIGRVHLALMGDPTLRMKMVSPPSNLSITNSNGTASFSWTASAEPVAGYHIYQFEPNTQVITRLTADLVTGTSYLNAAIPFISGREYMVRAVKLETNSSGSYYNPSLGAIATASGSDPVDCAGVSGGSALPGTSCNDNNANTGNDTWSANCQCVGQPIDCAGVAGGNATPGSACNDGNANTGNDTWNANCQCVGQPIDCAGIAGGNATPGTSCNDGNANTINDTWNANCQCVGTAVNFDCLGVANGSATPGSSCNDNNANTINDTWNANCQCVGTAVNFDCLGVASGSATPGSSCNDNNANTGNDTWNANCQCIGQPIDCAGVAGGNATPGSACNDGNANTINDTWNANCQCAGTAVTFDCVGVANGSALPGTSCNDNNANTGNDTWNANCQCVGQPIDCAGVAGGNATPGSACNDGNANTGNDTWNMNCQCIGQPIDCAGVAGGNATPGSACNDGNAGTINDTWNANCQCVGTAVNFDCLGVANGSATPGSSCNDNNANTGNDTWNANCQCIGQPIDCAGVAGGNATPGSACNDGNANTGNDTWNANCQCVGQPIDCAGVAGGSSIPGSSCNDGNAGTINDTWNANCQCAGTAVTFDCIGVANGSALPGTACNDGNANTVNDTWNANCECAGTAVILDCLGVANGSALPGTSCNDNNANTINDTWNTNCECAGTAVTFDCIGVANGSALPGTSCNDGNAGTINDTWNANCQCIGTAVNFDCLGVANGSAFPGTSCNDNNANTIDDIWNANCECVGTAVIFDCLGMANGSALPGTSCDDNNANTINDTWNANCECVGTAVTFDCLGVANGSALPGTSCDDGNALTGNDSWNANCECAGLPLDCAGVPGGSAAIDDCGTCAGGSTGIDPDQDADLDGLLDCEDICPFANDPLQEDFDNDGIGDACDNCTWTYNPDQADTNGNGIGDACQYAAIVGLGEMNGSFGFAMHPNPTLGAIELAGDLTSFASVLLHDMAGSLVFSAPIARRYDLGALPVGIYVVTALDTDGRPLAHSRLVRQ